MSLFNLAYFSYVEWLLFASGCLILYFDKKAYDQSKQNKEKKVASILAWGNISLAALTFVSIWIMQNWL